MTPRQKEVFDFIQSYINNRGIAPTYKEIIQATNIGYKSYLHRVLKNLKEQGKIEITSNKARGISICKGTVREKEQIKRLQKQLEIAISALEKYISAKGMAEVVDFDGDSCIEYFPLTNDDGEIAKQALKEIEELNK